MRNSDQRKQTLDTSKAEYVHRHHDRMTERLKRFNATGVSWVKTALAAAAITAVVVWVLVRNGTLATPLHLLTVCIWLGSIYLVHKIRTMY